MLRRKETTKPIKLQTIREIIGVYLSAVPPGIEDKIGAYLELLAKWSSRMPLTSLRDPEEIVRFHFGESIFALSVMNICANGRLADVGTGAGFPGLALKLADQNLSVLLVEANKKKCAFLHEAIRLLSVSDAHVISAPFETAAIEPASLSVVTCRALGRHAEVLRWAREKLERGGSVILWLGRESVISISRMPGWQWRQSVLIPGTRARYILRGVRDC